MTTDTFSFPLTEVPQSRLSELNLDNLVFGRTFADHMFVADFDGERWTDARIEPYGEMNFTPAMMALHYGQAIFEGMKAYKSEAGEVLTFRARDNWERFNQSARRMCMAEIPEEVFLGGLNELLRIDAAWVPQRDNYSLYVRPFMFATDEFIGVAPSRTYRFVIFTCPVGWYYAKPMKVKVETHYVRAAIGGTGAAKCAGNYAGSLYPTRLAQQEGYDQLIWTDAAEHRYIEEAGTMNFMFIINCKLITPSGTDSILSGITRRSIVQVARDWGMEAEERRVSVQEVMDALAAGTLEEAFGAGTAAVVSQIYAIGCNGTDHALPELRSDSFASRVKAHLDDIKYGRIADAHGWVEKVG